MKVKLEFNLPEEKNEFTLANMGADFYSALCKVDQECRQTIKYKENATREEIKLAELIRDTIRENVNMDCVD